MAKRIKSGITGFDLLIGGGIPAGHSVMLQSPIPLENSIFTYQYIKKGLENYEPVLVVLSKISPQKFREYLKVLGVDAREYENNGYLKIVDWYSFKSGKIVGDVEDRDGVICASKDLTNIGIAINRGIKALADAPVKRAVLDVLSQALNFFEYKRVYNFAQGMVARLRDNNITSIFTVEIHADEEKTLPALHGIFDGVIDVKLLREKDKLIRKIGILSMSGIKFDPKYRDFWIEGNEMVIGDRKELLKPPDNDRIPKPKPPSPSKPPKKLSTKAEKNLKEKMELVKDHPQNPDTWFSLGSALLTYERNEDALLAFDKVIELNPHHLKVWEAKGNALRALGRNEEAEECFKRSLEIPKEKEEEEPTPLEDLERELSGILEEEEKEPPPTESELEKVELVCPECGTALGEDDILCPNCGTRFDELEEIPDELLAKEEEKAPEEIPTPPLEITLEELEAEPVEEIPKPEAPLEEVEEEISLPKLETALEELEEEVLEEISKPQLETALEELEQELGKFVGEEPEPEEEVQLPKILECPECGAYVEADVTSCPNCGAQFAEISEVTEPTEEEKPEIEIEEELEKFVGEKLEPEEEVQVPMVLECPECGTYVEAEATSCPKCGAQFVEIAVETEPTEEVTPEIELEDEFEKFVREALEPEIGLEKEIEEYECPMCGSQVVSDDTMCPNCGVKFGIPEVGLETKLREEEFEPSEFPGLTNGLTNGLRRGVRGVTNGLTNGITNGLTNGLRALRSGITNGVTNGNGITNGITPYHKVMDKKRGTIRVVATIAFFLLLLLSPFLLRVVVVPDNIIIDGSFEDWSGVLNNTFDTNIPPFPPDIDIVEYRVDDRQLELSFYLRVEGDMLAGEPDVPGGEKHVDTVHIFIDTDKSSETGYYIHYIGADYMVKIFGWNGEVLTSSLHRYTAEDQDWNLWEQIGSVSSAVHESKLETKVSYNAIYLKNGMKVDVLFHTQSWDGFEDFSDTIISNEEGILSITQQGEAKEVISGKGNKLVRLELKPLNADIILDELKAARTGLGTDGDISRIMLEDEMGESIATGTMSDGYAIFRPDKLLNEGQSTIFYIVADVSGNAVAGNSIGFRIMNSSDVITDKGTVSLKRIKPVGNRVDTCYLIGTPYNVTIDGAFADWENKTVRTDISGDVNRADLDILRYGVSTTEEGTAFYLKVDGEICGGIEVPYRNIETMPEPTEPGEPGPPSPPAPPIPLPPPKTGEDLVYIFIDTIEGTGYSGGLPIGADYMIEVKGRYNQVLSKTYYKWSGTIPIEWNWTEQGSIDVGLDSVQMEIGIEWEDIGINPLNDRFDVYFLTTDWEEREKDYSNGEGPIEGPTRAYISDGKSRGYDIKYHGNYDLYFEEGTGEVLFETKDGFYLSWRLPQELNWEDENGEMIPMANLKLLDLEIQSAIAYWLDVYTNSKVSVEYLFNDNLLKENIVIEEEISISNNFEGWKYLSMEMPIEFSDDLKILTNGIHNEIGLITSNDIDFYSDGHLVYTIEAPVAIDAKGNSIECEYIITEEPARMLVLRCPSNWLETAVYPVRIDPSITYFTLETDDYINNWDIFGSDVEVGDFNGDGYADVLSGAERNDQDYNDGGRAYIFFGPFTGNVTSPNVTLAFATANWQRYGSTVGVGDFNNDGYDEAIVVGNDVDVCIKNGSSTLSGIYTTPDIKVSPVTSWSSFGTSLGAGNFNGDNNDDLVIGAPEHSSQNGKVYIYYYDSTDWGDGTIDDPPDDTLQSVSNTGIMYFFGYSLAIGNFYSGPLDDIVVGEPYYDSSGGGDIIGRVNLFDGDVIDDNGSNPDGPSNYIDNPQGPPAGFLDQFGHSIAAGDFNPYTTTYDFDDLIVGEPGYDGGSTTNEGRAYIFTCDDDSAGWQTNNPIPTDIANPEGSNGDGDQFGYAVGAGDVYSDGVEDFFIGAPSSDNNGPENGAVYIFDCDGSSIQTTYNDSQNGTSGGEMLGWSVSGGKYINDSLYNLIAGAPYWDDNSPSYSDAGRVWVIQIPEFRDFVIPTGIMITIFVIYRKRSTRKKRN